MMRALVLYHDACPDGFTAAWAVWRALGYHAEYRAVNYGTEPPIEDARGQRVILVDFSYPRVALDALARAAERVEVYDHHQTAREALADWADPPRTVAVFDMHRSGASIAWDEFQRGEARPALIDYVEDRDLWRWALPHSREINEYLFSLPRTFGQWDWIAEVLGTHVVASHEATRDVIEGGKMLRRAKRMRVEKVCENVRWIEFGMTTVAEGAAACVCRTYRVPVVNASSDMSEIGEHLCEMFPEAACVGYYFDRGDGKRQWGFRSRGDFDVAALCKQYGGGGHKAAAGFQSAIGWEP